MSLDQIPLFQMIRGKMRYDSERQRLIAENVANADTPSYAPRDLKGFSFGQVMKAQGALGAVQPVGTNAAHLPGKPMSLQPFAPQVMPDSESRLDGNQVVVEEQMIKMSETRVDYEAVVGFYQTSLNMLRTAARAPGK